MDTNIIKVKYEDAFAPKTFGGKAYSYYTDVSVEIGDFVIAPTAFGEKVARVSEINIPTSDIENIKDKLKTITTRLNKEDFLSNAA